MKTKTRKPILPRRELTAEEIVPPPICDAAEAAFEAGFDAGWDSCFAVAFEAGWERCRKEMGAALRLWQQASAPHTKGEMPADTELLAAGEAEIRNLQAAMGYLRGVIASKAP